MNIDNNFRNAVMIWLIIGLIMIFMQIVIGGITRLTGSGLSITEWEIVTGTLPPLSEKEWIDEFEKYKQTPQYEKINQDMEMGTIWSPGTFQFIYFWEYLHRLWARGMGFVFFFPFLFFYWKKSIPPLLLRHLRNVILCAILAATFGWIMVASGLIHRPWVNAYKLAIHLCIGIGVFMALWWGVIRYRYNHRVVVSWFPHSYVKWLLVLLIVQIFLGGVMSGTKAALFINTWPDLNGEMIPSILLEGNSWNYQNFNEYEQSPFLVSLIQILHRSVAYLLLISVGYVWWKRRDQFSVHTSRSYKWFFGFLFLQAGIGIATLVKSIGYIPVFWGVLHQGMAVIVLASFLYHLYKEASEAPITG